VDERCDPLKATRAAIKYLTFLHDQFDSWELAMAAYNSGPGRVRYAIRKSGTKDYWKLQRYLPRETRAYVPGFIAASYILNYYQDHGLAPELPSSDFTHTETVEVFKGISFTEISSVTGVPLEVIQELNPVFVRRYIPQSNSGYTLRLPVFAAAAMQVYLTDDAAEVDLVNFEGIETGVDVEYVDRLVEETYTIRAGDNLYNIARTNGCSVDDLKSWNRLSGNTIHIGQRLKIKKMAKVLIRVPKAMQVSRSLVEVPLLPVLSSVTNHGMIRQIPTPSVVPPVMPVQLDISSSPVMIRRRTSLRSLGIPVGSVHSVLSPGTSLE
jgi:membrane-bound lytic murein transglycosylase D